MFDEFDPPPSEKTSNTSVAAAEAKTPLSASRQRLAVMRALMLKPSTREELQDVTGWSGDTIRPRVWELLRHDPPLVERVGERKTHAGRMAEILGVSIRGYQWIERQNPHQ